MIEKRALTCLRLNLLENILLQYWHILGCLDLHDGPSSAAICSGVVFAFTGCSVDDFFSSGGAVSAVAGDGCSGGDVLDLTAGTDAAMTIECLCIPPSAARLPSDLGLVLPWVL